VLGIALAVNAVVGAVYYLRLISVIYFETGTSTVSERPFPAASLAGFVCAAMTIALFVAPNWLWQAASAALQ
jgi:NADH:ubiquinone oxidoreductase subunit 2 (subunit N)